MFRYSAATDTFTSEVDTNTFAGTIATNQNGTVTMASGGMVFDASLHLLGTIPGCRGSGVAVNAAGTPPKSRVAAP